jgi:hypothetical protein
MTFTVEIMLRETHRVFAETLNHAGNDPSGWTDDDVRGVMKGILGAINQIKNPGEEADRTVALRGVSWIVQAAPGGAVIAVDIPSGQAVAGPFAIDTAVLDGMLQRVMAAPPDGRIH